MAQRRVDEVLDKALSTDTAVIPRYDIVNSAGVSVVSNAQLILKNPIITEGMRQNKLAWDECLAASGITTGTSTFFQLAQEGFSLFNGAAARIQLHNIPIPGLDGKTRLNINNTADIPIILPSGAPLAGTPPGTWITVVYSQVLDSFIVQGSAGEGSTTHIFTEMDDVVIDSGTYFNVGAGWQTIPFSREFMDIPKVTAQVNNPNALSSSILDVAISIANVTTKNFQCIIRVPATATYYTATGVASTSANVANTLMSGFTTTAAAYQIAWKAIYNGGAITNANRN